MHNNKPAVKKYYFWESRNGESLPGGGGAAKEASKRLRQTSLPFFFLRVSWSEQFSFNCRPPAPPVEEGKREFLDLDT
jgi:hypothetical protein